jgi:tetratricopeptide (TPR) repeat protein
LAPQRPGSKKLTGSILITLKSWTPSNAACTGKKERPTWRNYPIDFEPGRFPLSRVGWIYQPGFMERLSTPLDEGLYQIKRFVFGEGIKAYKSALENSGKPEAQTSLLIGRGYKSLGDYEEALRQLERAHQINKEDSEILGEMADCYDMIGNTRIAKLFFREAFYINPQGIALEFIESKIVKKIIEKLEEKELNQDLLKEWIPVYGVLYGVFNVKRELRPWRSEA